MASKNGIVHEGNSGTVGAGDANELGGEGVGFGEDEVETEPSGMVIVCVLLQPLNSSVKIHTNPGAMYG